MNFEKFILESKGLKNKNKKMIHLNSTINLFNGIKYTQDSKGLELKDELNKYMELLLTNNYKIEEKVESMSLYVKYLVPVGRFLIRNKEFRTRADLFIFIIVGLIFEFIGFYIYSEFLFFPLILTTLLGILQRRYKIKKNEYYAPFW